ncbi:MAG TPA: SdiA-regulated domain-containing protein [Bacteroidia bacterium]|nr:SdiA-regulated domain-containing protein [Bacteroidia bacterium]
MKNHLLLTALVITCCSASHHASKKLKPTTSYKLKMTEPSDVCISGDGKSLYIASGDRYIYEVDFTGKIIRKGAYEGFDYEAVYADENYVYANDESLRRIDVYDPKTLNVVKSYDLDYNGPINKGFEALTWNGTKNCFVLVSEKNPCVLYEYDKDFRKIDEINVPQFREISSATYYNGNLWLQSDEEETLYKLNPQDYSVTDQWRVPVVNPEGIAFDREGNLFMSSDDMGKLFYFSKPQL